MVGSIFCLILAIISLGLCFTTLRDIVCNNLGEMRFQFISSKGMLEIIKYSGDPNAIAPDTKKLINELEQEVTSLSKKIEDYKKRWWWILKFNSTSCFDPLIEEVEIRTRFEIERIKKQKME